MQKDTRDKKSTRKREKREDVVRSLILSYGVLDMERKTQRFVLELGSVTVSCNDTEFAMPRLETIARIFTCESD